LAPKEWSRLCDGWRLTKAVRNAILEQQPTHVIGADEVGYGAWAGPYVVGAVLAPVTWSLEGLRDSKKMSPKRRDRYEDLLRSDSNIKFYFGSIDNSLIDAMGAARALELAFQTAINRALADVRLFTNVVMVGGETVRSVMVLTDGDRKIPGIQHYNLVKGDDKVPAISAASVLAKTYRDGEMVKYASTYPAYGWQQNKGYRSKKHEDGLAEVGTTPLHRMSYSPMSEGKFKQASTA